MLRNHRYIFFVVFPIFGILIVLGFLFYTNCFYAQRVLQAVEKEDIQKLEELLKSPLGNLNCKPNLWITEILSEKNESTPLQAACKTGNPEIVRMLLENGADVNYTHWDASRNQGSPLTNAAGSLSDERLQIIKLLIEYGANVNYEDIDGDDALSCAVYASFERSDTIEIIEFLEEKGADIYKKYAGTENTLLHKACESNSFLVIQYLVEERGFDIDAVNADGETALIYFLRFASERDEDILLFLLSKGANLEVKNREGKTAYDYALERHPELIGLFDQKAK